jgi:glutamyl-tRNA reductase
MILALTGVNHKTAPIALRERIAISREDLPETTRALADMPGVSECMIVSTCNRVELLAAVDSPNTDLTNFLHSHFGIDPAELAPHIYDHRDREAVRHLFRMAASLDSMVVGEPQILGQVKEAFAAANWNICFRAHLPPPRRPVPRPESVRIRSLLRPSPSIWRARFLVRCKDARCFW